MGAEHSSNQNNDPNSPGLTNPDINPEVPSTSTDSTNEESSKNGRRASVLKRQLSKMGSLIVVNPAKQINTDVEEDQMYIRLQQIPDFVPIVQNREKISRSKEGEEVRARLDPTPLVNIGLLFQHELQESARIISTKQNQLSQSVKEVERTTEKLVKSYTERQRAFAKHCEKFGKLNDLNRSILKCQSVLDDCKRTIHMLNELLPKEERLEPYVWSDDTESIEITK